MNDNDSQTYDSSNTSDLKGTFKCLEMNLLSKRLSYTSEGTRAILEQFQILDVLSL